MGAETGIQWTDSTFNAWWGCTKVSPGCGNCYAESLDKRIGGKHWGPGAERRTFGEKHWNEPRRWNAEAQRTGVRRRVFCSSMADVFDAEAPAGQLARLWSLIGDTPWLDWQLLTKRADRIAASLPAQWGVGWRNVWLGVTAEDQRRADERLPHLCSIPAAVRFVSAEPLLGPLDLSPWLAVVRGRSPIDWIIVGGESGHGARAMLPIWARRLRDQASASGVALHFKQWGEWGPHGDSGMVRLGKKAAGRTLDGRTHDAFPPPVATGLPPRWLGERGPDRAPVAGEGERPAAGQPEASTDVPNSKERA